ncbi:MAG: aspartate ammonia-lyase [Fimbriimonadales bacterium]|nr:aspartate ammonia-lyase [Fimbriimonadales bacterium]
MVRIERDALGERELPADVYWGLQTLRAQENFPISGITEPPLMIDAYVLLKKAAAQANMELGLIPEHIGRAIIQAADEILQGNLRDQFPTDIFHQGAGTSFHMNVNEVLANRAIEILGGRKGDYSIVHPNDHVNFGQSTNDTFPTAMRIATRMALRDMFPVLDELTDAFAQKGKEFDHILKSGRTHLQDAVPIRLGQEFAAYAMTLRKCRRVLEFAAEQVEELGIGGSAAGTGLNTHPKYRFRVVELLREWTGIPFRPAEDLREAMQSQMPIQLVGSALRTLALELTRIVNDLRLLASGPLTGLAEINLPAVQPGSSIMPGKVNPSIPEMANMVCFQVIGNATTIDYAVQAGQLELNVMMPVMAYNALYSIQIMTNMMRQLDRLCVRGITANEERCRYYAETSPSLATALNPYVGYATAAEVVKQALRENRSIIDVVRERKLLTEEQIKEVFDPYKMTEPGIPGRT